MDCSWVKRRLYPLFLPSIENKIPWKSVFSWVGEIKHKIFVNPEVHHQSQANDTISFCNKMMK
jgi:hypothetical protein